MTFRLYESDGCCLCKQAQAIVAELSVVAKKCELIDIAYSESYVEQFGLRIPVLEHVPSQKQLDWPFDAENVTQWLKKLEVK